MRDLSWWEWRRLRDSRSYLSTDITAIERYIRSMLRSDVSYDVTIRPGYPG